MIKKYRTDMQGPAQIYRLTRPVNTIVEGSKREKRMLSHARM